eukprot:symbB.v1.2.033230.t2/scaffold4101.1/size44675/2
MFPAADVKVVNKRNAFDVQLNGTSVWDGSAMGPPRALKFEILEGTTLHDRVVAERAARSGDFAVAVSVDGYGHSAATYKLTKEAAPEACGFTPTLVPPGKFPPKMRPGSAAAPVLVSVAYRQEPCRKPLRQTSLEALPTRLERSPPRGSPPRPSVQACVAGMTPLQAVAKPLHPQMQVPVSPLVLHTPRAPQAALRTIVRSGSQSRAMDRCSGAIQAERVSMPPASRPLHGQWSHCAVPASSRSWQPTAASPRWPNKEQQEQIERLTRQVQELREQQKRHQEWAQIPMAALGTERSQTQTLPLEEKGAKAPDFQKVLNDIPTACRNSMALRSPMPEVSLSSPRLHGLMFHW